MFVLELQVNLIVTALSLSTQQSTGSVNTNIADNTTDSKFQLVRNEGIGDYQVSYESVLDQLNADILQDADKKVLKVQEATVHFSRYTRLMDELKFPDGTKREDAVNELIDDEQFKEMVLKQFNYMRIKGDQSCSRRR